MKHRISASFKKILLVVILGITSLTLASCDIEKLFIFGGSINGPVDENVNPDIETFDGTKNAIFFALYNYYGYEGQHFTNKWLGMKDALAEHGITVTGYEGQKDARKFKITRECENHIGRKPKVFCVKLICAELVGN